MSITPTITVSQDMDSGLFELYATSYGRTVVAGPRLFRAPPHPDIRWQHDTAEEAATAAATLTRYLEGLQARKGPSKRLLRKLGAD